MSTRLIIHTPDSFRFRATLLSHGWLQLKPFGYREDYSALYRIQQLGDGTIVQLTIAAGEGDSLEVQIEGARVTTAVETEIRELVRRIFHLDLDLREFYGRIGEHSRYAWVETHGAGRLLRSPTVWEDLAKTLLTTNTTWSMTCSMVERLTELGDAHPEYGYAFPRPERIADLDPGTLNDHLRAGYRNAYLHELARDIAEGRVDVESWRDSSLTSAELFQAVRGLKGFGPYAAGAMLKLLGRYDELAIDSAVRAMFKEELLAGCEMKDAAIEEHYQGFGEWKGLVIWMDLMRTWFLEQSAPE